MCAADTGMNAVQSREASADLLRRVVGDSALPSSAFKDFALEKNPLSLAVVVLFFLIGGLAFVDGVMINQFRTIGHPYIFNWIPLSMALALPAYPLLASHNVPARESLTLTMLLGMAMIAATIPAFKRVDRWLADAPQALEFTLTGAIELTAKDYDAPALRFARDDEYWAQFERGSTHSFTIVHGPLGLWQYDETEFNERRQHFYQNRKSDRKP
jgi:hypothetical protein